MKNKFLYNLFTNQAIAEIKRLRDKINNECRERVIYDTVFKNLETDLKKND